jgi:putative transposase
LGIRQRFVRFPDPAQIKLLPSRHGWVVLPKLKWVRFRQSRPLPVAGRLLFATVARTGEHWYVSFQCEVEIADPRCPGSDVVGIDLGVANSITLSAGDVIQFPRVTATDQEKLAILDRRVASKQKGSSTDGRRSPVDTPTTASLQTGARTHSTKPRPCSPSATASS